MGCAPRLTALRLHEQTSQALFEVWIAIGRMEHPPPLDYPSLRILRISPTALAAGIETSQVESEVPSVFRLPKGGFHATSFS